MISELDYDLQRAILVDFSGLVVLNHFSEYYWGLCVEVPGVIKMFRDRKMLQMLSVL